MAHEPIPSARRAAVSRGPGRAARLARLRERLIGRPTGAADLARELGVTRRTVERDLATLRDELGAPLEVDAHHRYALPVPTTALNAVEALAVYSATRLLTHTGVGDRHYRSALVKLARQLPEPARGVLLRRVDALAADAGDRTLELVAQAWFEQRVLRCRYRSANGAAAQRRDLEVYFFELNRRNHEPYVLAFDRTNRRRVLVFKLARMQDVHLLDERYEPPADFDPEAALADSFGIVVGETVWVTLLADAGVARRFRELEGDGLIVDAEHPDGRLALRLRATLDAEGRALEAVPWLLGWGGAIEVVGPPDVRAAVAEAHRRAAGRYEADEA